MFAMTTFTQLHTSLSRIGQISLNAHDLARATDFYRDVLGVKYLFSVPKMAFFDCDGIRLMLSIPEKPEYDHPSSILYFKVPDIHEVYDTLASRDVCFESSPTLIASMPGHDLWMAFFRDLEGNLLALMSEVPK
jgi:catechol 2,3-dioxygenase-like lactoylglutathione lyase family enzyme